MDQIARYWRAGAVIALGLLGLPGYRALLWASADLNARLGVFGWSLAAVTALAMAGAALIWSGGPGDGRARVAEAAALIAVGFVWRALLWSSPPLLSADAYRYVWDGHLLLHGVSPYLHTPDDPALAALRDATIWPRLAWRTAPTIYPPGAEGLYALVNLIAPLSIGAMKAALALCDIATAALTVVWLRGRGLDPRRAILYWWSPLPIVEFALNGHIDAFAVALTLGAVIVASQGWRGARATAGALLGLAALVKIYPLLFALVLVRRGDRWFLATLGGSILLGYAALAPLGLGGGGFLGTYFSQRFVDQGFLEHWLALGLANLHAGERVILLAQFAALGALLGLTALWRWRRGLGDAAGILAISVAWMAVAPHILPWYLAALLPFLAASPLAHDPRARAIWLFALLIPFTYVIFAPGGDAALFQWFWLVPLGVALAPLTTGHGRATLATALRDLWPLAPEPPALTPTMEE